MSFVVKSSRNLGEFLVKSSRNLDEFCDMKLRRNLGKFCGEI
jgi:hypothetical protein